MSVVKSRISTANQTEASRDNRILAAIGYVNILCLLPLLFGKDNRFVQFHGKQGLMLFIAEVVIWFLNIIPVFGFWLWRGFSALFFIFAILGIVHAWKKHYWEMPWLGKYAKRINL